MARKTWPSAMVTLYTDRLPRTAVERGNVALLAGQPGVYALYKGSRLRYVGLAIDVKRRLTQHTKNRLRHSWDSFAAYLLTDEATGFLHDLEATLHRLSEPDKIRQTGRFLHGKDISQSIKDELTAGGLYSAIRNGKIGAGTKLKLRKKGVTFWARVDRLGCILLKGRRYRSPSLAVKAILGYQPNGWVSWEFERSPGVWRTIDLLR